MATSRKTSRSQVASIASRDLIDSRRLFYFFHVARLGSFSAAETFLDVAQSAMSRQIQQLESEIGVQLLERTGRGVALTEFGEILYEQADVILEQMASTLSQIHIARRRPAGEISVGGSSVVMAHYMPEILARFTKQFPKVRITAVQAPTGDLYERVTQGQVDVGVVLYVPNSNKLVSQKLMVEPLLLIGRKDHPATGKQAVTPSALAELDLLLPASPHGMREMIDQYFDAHGIEPKCQMQIDSVPLCKAIVLENDVCCIMPQSSFEQEFDPACFSSAPFRPAIYRTMYVASLAERAKQPLVAALTRHIVDVFKERN
ncbi:LysR family transcriptional regulator [Bordetella sp. BOR01]|uniref:LysR family transcriptional regulator n=1 Tax=Bordetella sp. BOR01 TaxID=2854779 RepID=UPI001C43EA98|nr:LysR family transcriptional regulator [Bordetella sp. BOR01]MBV7486457.1 LysR family transcriptional regulator [Bordetella sp. BOR01]